MEENVKLHERKIPDEEESGFDPIEWLGHFANNWYWFVFGLITAVGLSYMQNRKWLAEYKSTGSVIIDDSRTVMNSSQVMLQGFGIQDAYRNINNQVIMVGSYDLLGRVVDSLPDLAIDYFSKGRFKVRNLYGQSPVSIHAEYIAAEAYDVLFKLSVDESRQLVLTSEDDALHENFELKGKVGETIRHNSFFIRVDLNEAIYEQKELYFKFRTRESLIADFSSRLNINYVMEGSSVLEISLTSSTPSRDVDFINKLCEVYLISNLEHKNDAASKTIRFIDEQLASVSELLSVSEDDLSSFRQKNQIIDVSDLSGELFNKSTAYDSEINQLKLKESYLDYLIDYIKTNLQDGSVVAPTSLGLNEPMLMALVQQMNELIIKRSELSEKSMFYTKYTRELETVKRAINEMVTNLQVSVDIQKKDLNRRQAEVQYEINQLPAKELEMISIERRYKMNNSYYTLFLQKRAEAEILKASNTPDTNILDRARVLDIVNKGEKPKTTLLFLLLGLIVPATFVVVKESLRTRVITTRDVEKYSTFPLIGSVRHTRSDSPYLVSAHPGSSFTEMFRVIRTRLEFIARRKSNLTIMVTSSESGDGKTYFSLNLACVYALSSSRTLLVDLDIRKPSIHNRLGCDPAIGITNYLEGQCSLEEIQIRPEGAGFDFIPAGTIPPNAGELIRSTKLKELFELLKSRYEFIIVDTSPIGIVADAYAFAGLSDLNLFIVRSNKTHKQFLRMLSSQLRADNAHRFYSILNDVDLRSVRYSQYYSRKYAYRLRRSTGCDNETGYGYGYGYGYPFYGESKKFKTSYVQYYTENDTTI